MNKPLIFTAALMSAALMAGAAVDADNIYNRLFPEVKIVEYRREVRPGDTLWTICGEIATDKEDLRKLVYQAKKDNRIQDVGNLQPGTLVIVRVEEARNQCEYRRKNQGSIYSYSQLVYRRLDK